MAASTPSLSPLAASARVHCNRLQLGALRSTVKAPRYMRVTELVLGTLLSQPLRPAMPDPNPHPLRFGWYFESSPLSEAEAASVRLHSPDSLVPETIPEESPP